MFIRISNETYKSNISNVKTTLGEILQKRETFFFTSILLSKYNTIRNWIRCVQIGWKDFNFGGHVEYMGVPFYHIRNIMINSSKTGYIANKI